MVPTSMPLKPRRVLVPTMPGPIATTAASAWATVRARPRARVDGHGLEVAAERVAARDGGVDEVALAHRGDEIRHRHGQAGAVGHDVRETSPGHAVLERGRDRRDLAVERGCDDGHAVDRLHFGERLEVLLGAPSHHRKDAGVDFARPVADPHHLSRFRAARHPQGGQGRHDIRCVDFGGDHRAAMPFRASSWPCC